MSDTNNPESTLHVMQRIAISTARIQNQLSFFDTNKASGPENIFAFILKNYENEIFSYIASHIHA